MNGAKYRSVPWFSLLALAALVAASCGGSTKQGGKPVVAEPALAKPEPISAPSVQESSKDPILVTLLTGSAAVLHEGVERALDIGDELSVGDTVRTGAGASCDLQFGSMATVRVKPKTSVVLRDYAKVEEASKVDIGLSSGTILCKVQKLAEKDRFEVRTQTSVCGVRGTEFIVSTTNPEKTRVSVKKGKVAVIPASLDPAAVLERASAVSSADASAGTAPASASGAAAAEAADAAQNAVAVSLSAVLDSYFMTEATVIGENDEFVVTTEAVEDAEAIVASMEVDIAAAVKVVSSETAASGRTATALAAPPQAETTAAVPPAAESAAGQPAGAAAAQTPSTAAAPLSATQQMSRAVLANEVLSSKLKSSLRTGVTANTKAPSAASDTSKKDFAELVSVRVMPAPAPAASAATSGTAPSGGAQAVGGAATVVQKPVRVSVVTLPVEAEILFDGVPIGRGKASGLYRVGESLKVEVRALGFVPQKLEVKIESEMPLDLPVILEREQRSYEFRASPKIAEIILDGESIGTGGAKALLEVGTRHEVLFRAPGYVEHRSAFQAEAAGTALLEAKLERSQRSVTILVSPAETSISIGGKRVGSGSYELKAPSGETLKASFRAAGYDAKNVDILVEDRDGQRIEVSLERTKRAFELRAAPRGAELFLDGAKVGVGQAQASLEVGSRHEASARAPGYVDKKVEFTVSPEGAAALEIVLERSVGEVRVKAEPPEASIWVAGKRVGTGSYLLRASVGETVAVNVQATGWEPKTVEVKIEAEGGRELAVSLSRQRRSVEIRATPAAAEIGLDGVRLGQGQAAAVLDVGSRHVATARAPGYSERRVEFEVKAESPALVELALERAMRDVRIKVEPAEAAITIGGKRVGTGSYVLSAPVGDTVAVGAQATGWEPKSVEITVADEAGREHLITLARQKRSFTFHAAPKSAEIVLDGVRIGTGEASAVLEVGSRHELAFRASGYVEKRSSIEVGPSGSALVEASLERAARTVAVSVDPADALISVDGKAVGTGSYSLSVAVGDTIKVSASRKGRIAQERTYTASESGGARIEISLKESLVYDRLKAGSAAIVGLATDASGRLFASDAAGTVTAFDRSGSRLWSKETKNAPNELWLPVPLGDAVCFSGSKELVLLGAADGSARKRVELGKEGSHLFGNRSLHVGDLMVVPSASSLEIYDCEGSPQRSIAIAEGTLATPAAWRDSVIVLTQKGSVAVVNVVTGAETRKIASKAVQPVGAAPLVSGNTVFFSDRKGLVVAVDLLGDVKWTRQASAEGSGAYADLVTNGTGIFGLFKQSIVALSAADGRPLFEPLTGAATPPAIVEAGLVFGTVDGELAIHDPRTGARIRSIPLGAKAAGRPFAVDGFVAVGTSAGEIVIVNPRGQ